MVIDHNFFDAFAYILYGAVMLMLIYVFLFAKEINGAKSWIQIGGFSLQPSEFAKFATALVLAKYVSRQTFRISKFKDQLTAMVIIGLPAGLIILQGDTGTALVFGAFILVLFREGMSPALLLAGLSVGILFILTLALPKLILLGSLGGLSVLIFLLGKTSIKRLGAITVAYVMVIIVVLGVDFAFNNICYRIFPSHR